MSRRGIETEIKLALADAATGRKLLRKAGFRVARRRSFESNVIFDTPDSALRSNGMVLRVRRYRGEGIVTLKGRSTSETYKSRSELELGVSSTEAMSRLFQTIGFLPQFSYEKYRTEYRNARSAGLIVLDETPIGTFLEIEGSPGFIDRTARKLGFGKSDYITSSYGTLHREYCRARSLPASDMIFRRPTSHGNTRSANRKKTP